jgi:hypothetical protein
LARKFTASASLFNEQFSPRPFHAVFLSFFFYFLLFIIIILFSPFSLIVVCAAAGGYRVILVFGS